MERELHLLPGEALGALDLDRGVDAAVDAVELDEEGVGVAYRQVLEEAPSLAVVDVLHLDDAEAQHGRQHPVARVAPERRRLLLVGAVGQPGPNLLGHIGQPRGEAIADEQRGATVFRERAERSLQASCLSSSNELVDHVTLEVHRVGSGLARPYLVELPQGLRALLNADRQGLSPPTAPSSTGPSGRPHSLSRLSPGGPSPPVCAPAQGRPGRPVT